MDARQAEALVRDFAATWKAGIEGINQDVMAYFANFRNGMEILKQVRRDLALSPRVSGWQHTLQGSELGQ